MQGRTEAEVTRWTGQDGRILFVLTLIALVLRLGLAARVPTIEPDGAFYGRLAQDALRHTGTRGWHTAWPPGYPALVTIAARIGGLLPGASADPDSPRRVESAARTVSALAGALLVPLVVFLARRTVGARAAWVAGILVLAHPNLLEPSTQVMTEMTFALAIALTLVLLGPRAGLVSHALAGLGAGGALLVRPEGLLFVAGLTLALALGLAGPRRRGRAAVIGALGFGLAACLVAAPHVVRVSRDAGRPSFGAKSDYNLSLAYAGVAGVPDVVRSRSEYNNLTGRPPAGGFPERIPAFGLGRILLRHPATVARHLVREAPSAVSAVFSLATIPVALLALFGVARRIRAVTPEERLWLCLWLGSAGLYALVFVYRRFFTCFLPLLLIPAAAALTPSPNASPLQRRLLHTLVAILACAGSSHAFDRAGRPSPALAQRRLGEALGRSQPRGREPGGVAARKPTLAWYADLPILALPEGDSAAIVGGAVARGADYLLLDAFELGRERPELAGWIADEAGAPPGWGLMSQSGTGSARLRLFFRRPGTEGSVEKARVPPAPN